MTRLRSRTVEHSGITTAYYDEGEGPVLLLLHGFTGSKLDFHDQLGWFTDSYRVIVPDNRGHGESTHSEDEAVYKLDTLVDDLRSFVEVLDLQGIHLLGHSLGGMVVMRYAVAHPGRLASLMLMDTSPARLSMPEEMRQLHKNAVAAGGVPGLINLMRSAPRYPEVQNGIDYLGEDEHWLRVEEKLGQMDKAAYSGLGKELGEIEDFMDSLTSISCPTTILVGQADIPFIKPSRSMAEVIHGSRLEIISGAAHCPQYENADQWRRVISAHLAHASA